MTIVVFQIEEDVPYSVLWLLGEV